MRRGVLRLQLRPLASWKRKGSEGATCPLFSFWAHERFRNLLRKQHGLRFAVFTSNVRIHIAGKPRHFVNGLTKCFRFPRRCLAHVPPPFLRCLDQESVRQLVAHPISYRAACYAASAFCSATSGGTDFTLDKPLRFCRSFAALAWAKNGPSYC